mmetsp:Transcript_22620/g.37822  ORF Transcript_22620/g.37822 Transcript_22620/m.37822 type:complete len:304 (+) Transcript_22620:878-1789(+)
MRRHGGLHGGPGVRHTVDPSVGTHEGTVRPGLEGGPGGGWETDGVNAGGVDTGTLVHRGGERVHGESGSGGQRGGHGEGHFGDEGTLGCKLVCVRLVGGGRAWGERRIHWDPRREPVYCATAYTANTTTVAGGPDTIVPLLIIATPRVGLYYSSHGRCHVAVAMCRVRGRDMVTRGDHAARSHRDGGGAREFELRARQATNLAITSGLGHLRRRPGPRSAACGQVCGSNGSRGSNDDRLTRGNFTSDTGCRHLCRGNRCRTFRSMCSLSVLLLCRATCGLLLLGLVPVLARHFRPLVLRLVQR